MLEAFQSLWSKQEDCGQHMVSFHRLEGLEAAILEVLFSEENVRVALSNLVKDKASSLKDIRFSCDLLEEGRFVKVLTTSF